MALDVNQVAFKIALGRAEEVVKADVVERGRRHKAGNMAAQPGVGAVITDDLSNGVVTDQRPNAALHKQIAGHRCFTMHRDRIPVRGCHREGHLHPVPAQAIRQAGHQVAGTIFALTIQD